MAARDDDLHRDLLVHDRELDGRKIKAAALGGGAVTDGLQRSEFFGYAGRQTGLERIERNNELFLVATPTGVPDRPRGHHGGWP